MLGSNKKISIGSIAETSGPAILGVICFVALAWLKPVIFALVEDQSISINNLYTAIFDWASIQTGFLFAIYGFIAGKTDGFIGEIRHTRSMKRYNSYLKKAILAGFLLTITSIPLIVTQYEVKPTEFYRYYVVAAWFSIFMWAFFSFARAAYIFGILIRVSEKGDRVPAVSS
ncbi:MAG: hypothetical protein Q8M24_11995 [Pseudolabrys sp.]|nr:hypothetical protein [Pseudolabrys sp.]MDP2296168.1 hypothetical protein [Pseudolabrys sp.]